jgi:hypothetical protein
MKKTLFLYFILLLFFSAPAQENTEPFVPHIIVKWAPTGLLLGSASLQAEYNFGGRNSLTAKIGLPVNVKHNLTFDNEKAGFNMKATSFLAGYRTYFSKKHLQGLYYEPFFSYVNHTSEGTGVGTVNGRSAVFNFTNNYSGAGVGIQLGAQFFIGNRVVIDLFFLGPEINSATNNLKAVDASNTHYWTSGDAKEAERHIRDFLDQFPFISNRTKLMVDKEMKQITAVYKGALPGLRTGVSIGFSF